MIDIVKIIDGCLHQRRNRSFRADDRLPAGDFPDGGAGGLADGEVHRLPVGAFCKKKLRTLLGLKNKTPS